MRYIKNTGILTVILLAALYLMQPSMAQEVTVNVTIGDADPHAITIDEVLFGAASGAYTPSESADYQVNMSVTAYDINGYQDLATIRARAYLTDAGQTDTCSADEDVCYIDATCAEIAGSGTGNQEEYHCDFANFKFYADNGTWTFKAWAADNDGGSEISNTTTNDINTFNSLDTEDALSFNATDPGTNLAAHSYNVTLTSTNNCDGNARVLSGGAMSCSIVGNIPVANQRYDSTTDGLISSLGGVMTGGSQWDANATTLLIVDQESSGTAHIKDVFLGLVVPEGVDGLCSNTLTFGIATI